MPLNCVSEDTQLSKTSDVETNIQIKLPFALNGAPMTTRPQSLRNLSTYRIKNSSLTKPFERLNDSDYVLDNLLSENIIGANSNSTLRYESQTYTQKFIALHSGIWGESGTVVSIFFTARNDDMFHMYIPVTLTGTASSEENKFLKAWLDPSYTLPSPFNVNRLLEFSENNVRFRISNFCLKFNNAKKTNAYTLCKFNNPHTLKYMTGSSWLGASGLTNTAAPSGDSPASYRRITFNAILNFMLNGTIVNQNNRNFISTVEHIGTSSTPLSAIKPIFYSLTKDQLFTTSKVSATGVKGLQNIKCYPLDLASQVDDNGNIFIDQDKKPIQVKNIGNDNIAAGESDLSALSAEQLALNQKENNDYIKYVFIFAVVSLIMVVLVIAVVYYIYRQRISSAGLIASYQTAAFLAASSSVAAPAAAPVAPPAPGGGGAPAAPVAPPAAPGGAPAPGGGGAPAPGGGGAPAPGGGRAPAAAAPAP